MTAAVRRREALEWRELIEAESPGTPAGWRSSWGPVPLFATSRTLERPTFGPVIAAVAERMGKPLFPHQRYIADVLGEVQSDAAGDPEPGRLAFDDVVQLLPRRAGKTVLAQPLVARTCSAVPGASAWMMAQSRKSAVNRWRDATRPMLEALGSEVRRKVSIHNEELRWPRNDSVFLPVAASDEAMHGEEPALVLIDELWTLTVEALAELEGSFRPAWLVADGQSLKMSAAGKLSSTGLKLERVKGREAVLAGGRRGRAFFEWALPPVLDGVPVAELDDPDLIDAVLAMHPRTQFGLRRAFLEGQLAEGRAAFIRYYGGIDDDSADRPAVMSLGKLASAAAFEQTPETARVALAVEVDPDGLEATIVSAVPMESGYVLVEVIERREGVRWVAGRVAELAREFVGCVAVPAGRGRALITELAGLLPTGVTVLEIPAGEASSAQGTWKLTVEEQVMHAAEVRLLDPDGAVAAAAAAAGIRRTRSGPDFVRVGEQPVTALAAAAFGLWAALRIPAAPKPFRIL